LGVRYAFFSAANAAALQQAQDAESDNEGASSVESNEEPSEFLGPEPASGSDIDISSRVTKSPALSETNEDTIEEPHSTQVPTVSAGDDAEEDSDPRARVLTVLELEALFSQSAPDLHGTPRMGIGHTAILIAANSFCPWAQ
jgi:large subunit GTPase 1